MISLSGVRVALSGTGLTNLRVLMHSSQFPIINSTVQVIGAIAPGLGRVNVTRRPVLDVSSAPVEAQGELEIRGNFINSFVGINQKTPDMVNGTEFIIRVANMIEGIEVLFQDNKPKFRVGQSVREGTLLTT